MAKTLQPLTLRTTVSLERRTALVTSTPEDPFTYRAEVSITSNYMSLGVNGGHFLPVTVVLYKTHGYLL